MPLLLERWKSPVKKQHMVSLWKNHPLLGCLPGGTKADLSQRRESSSLPAPHHVSIPVSSAGTRVSCRCQHRVWCPSRRVGWVWWEPFPAAFNRDVSWVYSWAKLLKQYCAEWWGFSFLWGQEQLVPSANVILWEISLQSLVADAVG